MKSHISPRDIRKRATDILNRFAPVSESLEALIDLATTVSGFNPCPVLGEVDLEKDVTDLAEQVQFVFRELTPTVVMNFLLVTSLLLSDNSTARPILLSYLSGQNELDPDDFDAVVSPVYWASEFHIRSTFLNEVERQNDDLVAELVALSFGLPATGVLFDAAVRELGLPYTVVVATDDFDPYPFVLKRS